jgi:hypothetical protein
VKRARDRSPGKRGRREASARRGFTRSILSRRRSHDDCPTFLPRLLAATAFLAPLAPPTSQAQTPTPVYKLAVHAIPLADDDGSRPATVTGASVAALIQEVNQVFAGTGIQFTFDPATDFESLMKSTALNRLNNCCGNFWSAGNAIAASYPDKVVIFFRWGPDPAARSGWAFAYPPAPGSNPDAPLPTSDVHFVAYMSDGAGGGNGLAHELGHYLGLYHTFPGWGDGLTATLAQVGTRLRNAGGLEGLDGDGLSDTLPDAGRTFYLNNVDSNLCSGKSKRVTVVVDYDDRGHPIRETFTIAPDFHNAMSYYYPCGVFHFSPQQTQRMGNTLQGERRRPLLRGLIGIGTDDLLYTRASLDSSWVQVADSGLVTAVTELRDGTIVAVGLDQFLWTRSTLSANWVQVPDSGWVIGISQLQDGRLLGVGADNQLYTRLTLDSEWVLVPDSGLVTGVTVLPDGTIVGIGLDQFLWTRATLESGWVQVPDSGWVIGIAALQDGTIVGIGTDNLLYTRATLDSPWTQVPNSGWVIGIAAR